MAFNANGSLWITGTGFPTPGTTVQQQSSVNSWGATTPLFAIYNQAPAGGPSIWPKYLRMMLTGTAPTATVSLNLSVMTDPISRLPTNANQYTNNTPVNCDTRDQTTASVCKLYHFLNAQAFTSTAASGSVKQVARGRIPTGLGVTGDDYIFQFGVDTPSADDKTAVTAVRATDPARLVDRCAGFSIAPGMWCNFYSWWLTAATTVQSWETELCWYEL